MKASINSEVTNSVDLIRRMTESAANDAVCAVVVLRAGKHGLETLTQKNKDGEWGLCGGHPDENESAEETAQRELREESGIDTTVEYLLTDKEHDRRKCAVKIFYAVVDRDTEAEAGSDAKKVKWRPVDDLGKLGMSDRKAIRLACQQVDDPDAVVKEAIEVDGDRFNFSSLAAPALEERVGGVLVFLDGNYTPSHTKALEAWLAANQIPFHSVNGNVSSLAESSLQDAQTARSLTPLNEALIIAADGLETFESVIQPKLREDVCVLAGPWIQVLKKRCLERDLDLGLIESVFRWLPEPDIQIVVVDESPEVIAERFATLYRLLRPKSSL